MTEYEPVLCTFFVKRSTLLHGAFSVSNLTDKCINFSPLCVLWLPLLVWSSGRSSLYVRT